MLSRTNSNAGDRLRRAKSNSSTSATSSHLRRSTILDPQTSRQQAEVAAVEAFERAQVVEPSRPPPRRRRSGISGKSSECSHFEDARRRSVAAQTVEHSRYKTSVSHHAPSRPSLPSQIGSDSSEEHRVVTRRRSLIPPVLQASPSFPAHSSLQSSTSRTHQQPVEYMDGSPAPRYSQFLQESNPPGQSKVFPGSAITGCGGHHDQLSSIGYGEESHMSLQSSPLRLTKPSADRTNIAEGVHAAQQYLQSFEKPQIRQRRSFLFGTFAKRRSTAMGSEYDTTLPPFNYADDTDGAPPPPISCTLAPAIKSEQKPRTLSKSIKSRLQNAFRKPSRLPGGLPAQHVEAKDFHFTVRGHDASEDAEETIDMADPFMTIAAEEPRVAPRPRSKASTTREERESARSRVTSWTNSTIAAMSSIRTNHGATFGSKQGITLKQKDSIRTLSKRPSFLGPQIRNKLRRTSKAELKGFEESAGLYSALQKRMRSSKSVEPVQECDASELLLPPTPTPLTSGAIASLPSQQQDKPFAPAPTIRAIMLDYSPNGIDIPSPVHEVTSPASTEEDFDTTLIRHDIEDIKAGLKRRPAKKAPSQSLETLNRRMERSKSRWQSPLDDFSSAKATKNTRAARDDSYKFGLGGEAMKQVIPMNGIPCHAKIRNVSVARMDVVSPSVYSRATDGATPRADTPDFDDGTTITITGREVRRYSISPPKPTSAFQYRSQASGAWRQWLADEMNGFTDDQKLQPHVSLDVPIPRKDSGTSVFSMPPNGKHSMVSMGAVLRQRSVSPLSDNEEQGRSRSRASSNDARMNGRYPMLNPNRNSSLSFTSSKQASPTPRPDSPEEMKLLHSSTMAKKPSIDAALHSVPVVRPATSARAHTMYPVAADWRYENTLEPSSAEERRVNVEDPHNDHNPVVTHRPSTASIRSTARHSTAFHSNRPKSAHELRVKYKARASERAKPLEVRRKPVDNSRAPGTTNDRSLVDDSTILNIVAGPYSSKLKQRHANHENTRPIIDSSPLQSLSSSEWLAAGSSTKKQSGPSLVGSTRITSPLANATAPADSPSSSPQQQQRMESPGMKASDDKRRSPGQRLATNWLEEKSCKSKEDLRSGSESAFV